MTKSIQQRLEEKFIPVTESGCWIWVGASVEAGYGVIRIDGKNRRAHRISYECYVGEIPEGLIIRHKCDVVSCINPDHLELGTQTDNVADRDKRGRHGNNKITHCPKGHPYSGDNLYMNGKRRCCVICSRAATKEWRKNKKENKS